MNAIEPIGWSLLHFIWQGALIGAVLFLVLAAMRRGSANARYVASCVALACLAAAPALTFGLLVTSPDGPTAALERGLPAIADAMPLQDPIAAPPAVQVAESAAWPIRGRAALERGLPWIVGLWCAGALLSLVRLGSGWLRVNRLRRTTTEPVSDRLQRAFGRLVRELGIARPVRLVLSARVGVPTAMGWLRPVVIVPACALTGLSFEQLEAVLAHELAHIRRHDYVVNLLQAVVEALLFYHPVWWVSRQVRNEREHCCDDIAVDACGDALTYARALTALELNRRQLPAPALAATGGSLLDRIRRLAHEEVPPRTAAAPTTVALVLLLGGVLVASQSQARPTPPPVPPAAPEILEAANRKSVKKGTSVRTVEDDGETTFQINDGSRKFEVRLRGELTLDRDLTTIESITPGGRLMIYERRRGESRELRILPDTAGRLEMTYRVDDRVVPFDRSGTEWLASVVPTLMRSAGFGAAAHVRLLLAEDGVEAVLDEIDRLKSNSVQRIFYEELLIRGNLSASRTYDLTLRAANDITSNSNRAALLAALAEQDRLSGAQIVTIAGDTVNSNSTMSALLLGLLAEEKISPLQALDAMNDNINSQSTRAAMLLEIAGIDGRDPRVRDAVIDALDRFSSDSTLAALLTDLEQSGFLTTEESVAIAVREINSNSTLAGMLADRTADGSLGAEEALGLGAEYINSPSTYADLLYRVAVAHRDDPEIETLLRRYLREINSTSTRNDVEDRLERKGLL